MNEWRPKRSFDQIRRMTLDLQDRRARVLRAMCDIQRLYDVDLVVPLPDVDQEPTMPNLTPQLMTDVIDGLAQRAASVKPAVKSPAKQPYVVDGPGGSSYARDRVRILHAVYADSGWTVQRRKRFRHATAYDTCTIVVTPDQKRQMPRLSLRSPLETFPEPRALESADPAEYVAFITRYSGAFLRERFPATQEERGGPITVHEGTRLWDVFEWYDDDQICMGLLGPDLLEGEHVSQSSGTWKMWGGPCMPLTRPQRNKAGVPLALTPQAVTLHSLGNRLNRLIENVNWQNRLMALEVLAAERAIFPDMFAMSSRSGGTPTLLDGAWHDGRTGLINLVSDAEQIGVVNQAPSPTIGNVRAELQRSFQNSSGLRDAMYGQAGSINFRTGRALSAVNDMSIEPMIQEMHEVDERWMPFVNEGILRVFEGWWPRKRYTMFSGWHNDDSLLEFTPAECIEGVYHNKVSYAIPGADIVQLSQVLTSLSGAGKISDATFGELHPYIQDPRGERDALQTERLDAAFLAGMEQQVASGQMPVTVLARIRKRYNGGEMSLVDAVVEVDNEIREEQAAAQAQAQPDAGEPALNAMLGLAAGPAAAAPGAVPPNPGGPTAAPSGAGPAAQMRQLLSAAAPQGV